MNIFHGDDTVTWQRDQPSDKLPSCLYFFPGVVSQGRDGVPCTGVRTRRVYLDRKREREREREIERERERESERERERERWVMVAEGIY